MPHPLFPATLGLLAALLLHPAARAGEGHAHGDAAPAAADPAPPRFAAVAERFELVGVLQGRQITLYLDRATDNAPVREAQIELEIAGLRLRAEAHEELYEAELPAEPQAGLLPILATVTVDGDTEQLAAELDLHEAAAPHPAGPARRWTAYAVGSAALRATLRAIGAAAIVRGRRAAAARLRRAGGVA